MSSKIQVEDALCFNLYSASRAMTQVYRGYLQEVNLTYPQFLVMNLLWSNRDIPLKEVGERLYLDSGTLTPLLKRMESMELLVRERSKLDEREVKISLTKKGRALEKKCKDIPGKMFSRLNVSEKRFREIQSGVREILLNLRNELEE